MGKYDAKNDFEPYESRLSKTIDRVTSPAGRVKAVLGLGAVLYYMVGDGDGTAPQDFGFPESGIYATPIVETPESATVFVVPAPAVGGMELSTAEVVSSSTVEAEEID